MGTDRRQGTSAWTFALPVMAALVAGGCAHERTAARPTAQPEVVLAYDDGRPTGTLAFPTPTYESVVRFNLPAGRHRPLRLRLQAGGAGSIEVTLYDNAPLDMPGQPLFSFVRELASADLSNGKDSRWLTTDLGALAPVTGVVWVGVRKTGGEPIIWTSAAVSGQTFVRDSDPKRTMGLLPVRRTPMIRLELAP